MSKSSSFPKALIFFFLGLLSFYAVLALKFQYFVVESDESPVAYGLLLLSLLLCGIFMAFCFRALSPRKSWGGALMSGLGVAIGFVLVISIVESVLSNSLYSANKTPEEFSVLNGHCGVYAGRGIFKMIHADGDSPREGAYQEFKVNDECRRIHFSYLLKHDASSLCDASEDGIDCRVRWMTSFADHGFWDHNTRKFFFDQVMKIWPDSKREEQLVRYVLKDQELEAGKQSILRQAGVDETLNDRYMLIQEKEDLDDLILTRDIFNQVSGLIVDSNANPPPYLFKFRDAMADFQNKLNKIPELEKEVRALESGPQI